MVNLGELNAMTHDSAEANITDNIYHRHVALMAFKAKEKTYRGGSFIREGLEYSDDPESLTGKAIEATGSFDVVEIETADAAQFRPRYYIQTIPLWDADVADNYSSEVQYWNYVSHRQQSYMRIMQARFARHLYQSGGNSLQINGLGDIFDNTQPFGRIDREKNEWWRSFVHDNDGTPQAFSMRLIADLISDVSDGDMEPDVIFTSTAGWNAVQAAMHPLERFPNTTLANMGFRNVTYQGAIPFVYDKYCDKDSDTRHKYYALNFDHIMWRPHVGFNMKTYDWMRMPKNLGSYMLIVWFGNVTSNALRRQGLLKDINPSATTMFER